MCKQWICIVCLVVMLLIGFAGQIEAYQAQVTYTFGGIDLDLGIAEHDPTMLWLLMGDLINDILRLQNVSPDFSPTVDLSFEFVIDDNQLDPLASIEVVLHDSVNIAMVADGTPFQMVGADTPDGLTFLDTLPGSLAADDDDVLNAYVLIALTVDNRYFKLGHFQHLPDLHQLTLDVEEILMAEPSAIPEPSTLLLLGLGAVGLIGLIRLRRRLWLLLLLVLLASLIGAQPLYAQEVTIRKAGCGRGMVLAGEEWMCDADCDELSIPYDEGMAVLLKTEPEDGSVFVGWENEAGILLTQSFKPLSGDIVRAVFDCEFETVSLADLPLNRMATKLFSMDLQGSGFHDAHTGFQWNDGDNETLKWRPQGIAGIGTMGERNFLAVSWNGREGYEDRGVRISFVDLISMQYRHVLLVDEVCKTFEGMTGGGLVYRLGELHVPDTRDGTKKVHVFSIDSIREVPPDDFYGYAYILKRTSSYDVPITPSFLSYDRDRDQVLTGTFSSSTARNLAWYTIIDDVISASPAPVVCGPFFEKMQGAASTKDPDSNNHVLWVASSYGSENSQLRIKYFDVDSCADSKPELNDRVITYPPGLQDMHISISGNIWMHTALGPDEGDGNNRIVFATKKDKLMPYNKTLSLGELDLENGLNRTATVLSSSQLEEKEFLDAHTGFQWYGKDGDDNKTEKWRPQGIAEIEDPDTRYDKRFLAVSWYGRKDYEDRGVRISFVDITNIESSDTDEVKYRHVLLVDEEGNTFEGMHAGGLVYRHGKLHVPDTRDGAKKIYVFSIDSIKKVDVSPDAPPDGYYNYAYILKQDSSYDVPITPSFLSYDWDRDQMLVGTFNNCCCDYTTGESTKEDMSGWGDNWENNAGGSCETWEGDKSGNPDSCGKDDKGKNSLAWYTTDHVDTKSCDGFFYEMQGAVSDGDTLWVTTSYGRGNDSYLHIANFKPDDVSDIGDPCGGYEKKTTISYPPGLEDMHISQSGDIWMLTEFGSEEGSGNNRIVFATKKDKLMP